MRWLDVITDSVDMGLGVTGSLPYELQEPARLLCSWNFPGKNTGVGTGLIQRCAGKAGNPFQTTQGNRLSCRDQEGISRPCRKRGPSAREDGGVSGVSSSCGARGGFLPRHDEYL